MIKQANGNVMDVCSLETKDPITFERTHSKELDTWVLMADLTPGNVLYVWVLMEGRRSDSAGGNVGKCAGCMGTNGRLKIR
jgi:hypothetical protein|tara:strand:+ start:32 stop:274 length:243 start_codon:yes stop_codon:yes gene_type:complete